MAKGIPGKLHKRDSNVQYILTRGSLYNNPSDMTGKYGWDLNEGDDQHFPEDLQTAFDSLSLSGGAKDTYKLRDAAQNVEFTNDARTDNVGVPPFRFDTLPDDRFRRYTVLQVRLPDFGMTGLKAIRRKSPIGSLWGYIESRQSY